LSHLQIVMLLYCYILTVGVL